MKLNILIVDDNPTHAVEIEMILDEIGYPKPHLAKNLTIARSILATQKIDVVLLDMQLGNEMGHELYTDLKKSFIPFIVITSFNDENVYKEAALASPEAFLVKPVDKLTLVSLLDRIQQGFENESVKFVPEGFFIKVKNNFKKIIYNDLMIVKAEGNYCTLYTSDQRITIRSTLKKLMEHISNKNLVRVHRSYIINTDYIKSIDFGNNIIFIQNMEVTIGKNFKSALKKMITTN